MPMRLKRYIILLSVTLLCGATLSPLYAQKADGKKYKKAEKAAWTYTYNLYEYHEGGKDTSYRYVLNQGALMKVWNQNSYEGKQTIPGYTEAVTYVDLDKDTVYYQMTFADGESCYAQWPYAESRLKWDTIKVDAHTTKYVTSVNSNRMEFVMTDQYDADVNPSVSYGRLPGVLKQFIRNGQVNMELGRVQKTKWAKEVMPTNMGTMMNTREMGEMQKRKMILTTRVFDGAQLYWHTDPEVDLKGMNAKEAWKAFPYDTAIHYAGGTVVLKRMHFDTLPSHYQLFAELHQCSNGDAYDRTGSIFVIPQGRERTFFEGMYQHPDSLPLLKGRDGERYQGVVATDDYLPLVELVRFFTPFGVRHFNGAVSIDGLEWENEAYYKQEITELAPYLRGDVWVGAFIGNYDAGGHKIWMDIKAYPGDEVWTLDGAFNQWSLPLINTTNVLEMAGQNYGKMFATDSLTVEFDVPEGVENLRIRYLSTGHGGWGGGDEFNPKENQIFIDGERYIVHTPWRSDCGTFREMNPVSGNFWNGVSSSDYSRSGWCPGTATQPVYFDLSFLTAGHHKLTIAIPQGANIEGGFNAWNLSLILLGDKIQ